MSDLNKNTSEQVSDIQVDVGTAADVEAIMKKYDRESNTRIWEGTPQKIIRLIMVVFSVYSIWVTLFGKGLREVRLTNFLAMIIIIGYLNFPARKGEHRVNFMPWYDWLLMISGAFGLLYFSFNATEILKMATRVTRQPFMVAIAIISILSLMELCRRCVGIPILCVVCAMLIYTFANVRFGKVIYDLFYTTSGIINTPIDVCAKYIVVFIIFGAFLERAGIANVFIEFANCVAGSFAGGPAKAAVIASALEGMVSGSSVGNTVGSGSITIPLMKKLGYRPEFAGAVEAAASTGGQIMPPIMGAAAFLMAEYMGVPYAEVAMRAILPAILYFTGIFITVHMEAKRLGLRGIPRNELPKMRDLIKKVYLLTPLVVLIALVGSNSRTMQFSASVSILVTIAVGLFNKEDRINFTKILDALEAGAKGTITVAAACAMAGIVAGCITSTGLASKLITTIVSISGGRAFIALLLTMVCCIILGMGVPTTANYCIMAATCASILISPEIGINVVAAHFFVFYFGIVADITPPVALAAYAGSAIAKAPPMKTALQATKLAIAAFVVPYIFAMSPSMLFIDTTPIEVVMICVTSLLGIFGVSAGLSGYMLTNLNPLMRILSVAAGITLMIPGTVTDIVGLVLFVVVILAQKTAKKATA